MQTRLGLESKTNLLPLFRIYAESILRTHFNEVLLLQILQLLSIQCDVYGTLRIVHQKHVPLTNLIHAENTEINTLILTPFQVQFQLHALPTQLHLHLLQLVDVEDHRFLIPHAFTRSECDRDLQHVRFTHLNYPLLVLVTLHLQWQNHLTTRQTHVQVTLPFEVALYAHRTLITVAQFQNSCYWKRLFQHEAGAEVKLLEREVNTRFLC